MNEAMLRQLFWTSLIVISLRVTSGYIAHPDYDQCKTTQCNVIDDIFSKNIKINNDPCRDLFKHTCSRNASNHSYYNRNEADAANSKMQDFEDILSESMHFDIGDSELDALRIEKLIYQQCKNGGVYNERTKDTYRKWLHKQTLRNPSEHWSILDKKIAMNGFGFAFFDIDVIEYIDQQNISPKPLRYIQISPPNEKIYSKIFLLTSKYMDKLQSSQDRYSYSGHSFHSTDDKETTSLKDFIEKLNNLQSIKSDEVFSPDDDLAPRNITLPDWQNKWDNWRSTHHPNSQINWQNILSSLWAKVGVHIRTDEDSVIIKNEKYFELLVNVLRETGPPTIVDYIKLRLASKTIGWAIEEYKDEYSVIPPVKGLSCTPGLLVGTAYAHAKQYFPNDNQIKVEQIYIDIRDKIKEQLGPQKNNYQATSSVTKKFLRQLDNFDVLIGYPKWLYDEKFINNFYKNMPVSEVNFNNQYKLMDSLLKYKLQSYKDSTIPIIDINIFFKSFTDDRITFAEESEYITLPVQVFNENHFKFVSTQISEPINYAAAGTLIAYELYMKWLNLVGYSTQNAPKCMNHQMPQDSSSDELSKQSAAYLLGALAAFEAWPMKDSYPIQFPMFGPVSDYRLFFLSLAESFCVAKKPLRGEPHPSVFINFVASNMPEFVNTFACNPDDQMIRRHPCHPLSK